MAGYLSRLSPVPAFPSYTGPYKVGTVDVEIPVADLYSPAPCPDNAKHIKTVQFRVFYPAPHESNGKKIPWLPNPQRAHVAGYAGFLGMGSRLAEFASFLPRHLHYANIPVIKNARLLSPSQAATPELPSSDSESATDTEAAENARWPTVIFSHGLGGSRNAYSHIAGSLASYGLVVFCPEHRDGSSVVSFIRDPDYVPSLFSRQSSSRTVVPYNRIAHEEKPEISEVRDEQIRIRCWEMGLIHDAIIKLDKGVDFRNLNASTPTDKILQFKDTLKVHNPGDIIFAGHSFGAGMTVQFLKSVFYHDHPTVKTMKQPLYVPDPHSTLVNQITPQTVTILLDMWCFPLVSPWTPELWALPLPDYSSSSSTSPSAPAPPGGTAILAIESESFYKWTNHLHATARAISPRPSAHVVSPTHFSESETGLHFPEPRFFYVRNSAHLNQSDFGVLFPWMTKKVFGAAEPERVLRLNMRAMLQHLRTNGIRVARTWVGDLVEDGAGKEAKEGAGNMGLKGVEGVEVEGISDDQAIFERDADAETIDYWHWIDVVGLGGESRIPNSGGGESEGESTTDVSVGGERDKDEEREMEGAIEPKLEPKDVAATAVTSAL